METKNNSGAIFKNDKKTAETHPDYKGKVNVNGKEPYVKPAVLTPPAEPFTLDEDDLPF